MTFETLFLRGLFGACALVCALTLLAMITAKPVSSSAASNHAIAASVIADNSHAAG